MSKTKITDKNVKNNEISVIQPSWDTIKLEFKTEDSKKIEDSYIEFLYYNVNRNISISKFFYILKDMDESVEIEKGIFEFTLIYASFKNYTLKLLPAIYFDKVNEIELNLKDNNYLGNKTLRNALAKHIGSRTLAFLKPQDLHPERWGTIIKKNNLREEKKNNMPTTDLYVCQNCEGSKCRMVELQLRSADEPTTKIITCMDCYHVEQRE
jgi:DNA-directed RNA polymerase subunit M/transcription elongation factor TFIIS